MKSSPSDENALMLLSSTMQTQDIGLPVTIQKSSQLNIKYQHCTQTESTPADCFQLDSHNKLPVKDDLSTGAVGNVVQRA